jgi:hypothetical protein
MNRVRALSVLFTALAVTFSGTSVASASGHPGDENGPEIIRVGNARAEGRHPDVLWVRVVYVCESRREDGTLELTLEQRLGDHRWRKAVYEGQADATCDGWRQSDWVELDRVDRQNGRRLGFAQNGRAWLDVTLTEGGRWGDSVEESFSVRVTGAGRN